MPIPQEQQAALFTHLYEQHFTPIRIFIDRFVHSRELSEDLAQDVFTRIWTHLGTLDATRNLKGYLYVTAHSLVINYFRGSYQWRNDSHLALQEAGHESYILPDVADTCLASMGVQSALSRLPQDDKSILVAREYEGCKLEQLAEITGVSERTVRDRLSRIRAAFREEYRKEVA